MQKETGKKKNEGHLNFLSDLFAGGMQSRGIEEKNYEDTCLEAEAIVQNII